MQDRFKFRVFHTPTNSMYDVVCLNCLSQNEIVIANYEKINGCAYISWDECPILQCTGLKDKNGKLIFEGDIVKDNKNKIYKIVFEEKSCGFLLYETEEQEYYYPCYNCDQFKNRNICKMEVIGNIYENPELLKEVQE